MRRIANKHQRGRWEWAGTRPRVLSTPLARLCPACERELDYRSIFPRCERLRQSLLMRDCKLRGPMREGWRRYVYGYPPPHYTRLGGGRISRAIYKGYIAARQFYEHRRAK